MIIQDNFVMPSCGLQVLDLASEFSSPPCLSPDSVGPAWPDSDPGRASGAGAGPAGPDTTNHHPAAPDCGYCWPDTGNGRRLGEGEELFISGLVFLWEE